MLRLKNQWRSLLKAYSLMYLSQLEDKCIMTVCACAACIGVSLFSAVGNPDVRCVCGCGLNITYVHARVYARVYTFVNIPANRNSPKK